MVAVTPRPLFSASWHRVAELRPRLRTHAALHRQQFRGETWYVLEDRVGERFHRFAPAAYQIIGLMDGSRTVRELWELACSRLGDSAPTQDDLVHLLAELHAADLLQAERTPDAAELFERGQRARRRRTMNRWLSVFSWRMSLVDPERTLQRLMPWTRWLAGGGGALLWVAVVVPAAALLALHWRDFGHGALDHLSSAHNVVAFWVLFVLLKAIHELGHAVFTKAYGGEVHDMGVMLLVFNPVPYVDASAAWTFPEKWRRIAVGGAGMLVELFVGGLAMFVWLNAEPGLVRTLAFDTIVIAGVSTVLFNANPLMRFDGYYMLADWLEIPNLQQRSCRYVSYLCERYLFGAEPRRPRTAAGEPAWFVAFAVASLLYRVLMIVTILLILGRSHVYRALVAVLLITAVWFGIPIVKGVAHVLTSRELQRVRARAIAVSAVAAMALVALLGFTPVPYRSRAEGVIWVPDEALVRTNVAGFVDRVVAEPGHRVHRGQTLFTLRDDTLVADVAEIEAQRRELLARHDTLVVGDRAKAQMVSDELRYVDKSLAEARRRLADLCVVAGTDGTFVVAAPEDLPARFVKKGELVGYVLELDTLTVRGVIPQSSIDLIRYETHGVDVRLAERLRDSVPGVIRRVVPAATDSLPTTALGTEGGGALAVDPRDNHGATALERVFQVDVELPRDAPHVNVGGRAYLRFDHGRAPLASQWYRQLRQLFLSRFDV